MGVQHGDFRPGDPAYDGSCGGSSTVRTGDSPPAPPAARRERLPVDVLALCPGETRTEFSAPRGILLAGLSRLCASCFGRITVDFRFIHKLCLRGKTGEFAGYYIYDSAGATAD